MQGEEGGVIGTNEDLITVHSKLTTKETFLAMMQPGAYKPFLILLFYFVVYQFGGVNTITFYAVEIFAETGSTMDKNTCTIMIGVVRLIFTIIAIMSLRKFGRRTLTFVSSKWTD